MAVTMKQLIPVMAKELIAVTANMLVLAVPTVPLAKNKSISE